MEIVIISLALLIFIAHLLSALFNKTRIPEVLPLMILGILLGPIFRVVSPSDFGLVDQVFTRILLIVILFESGLHIRISQIRSTWAQSSRLLFAAFFTTVIALVFLARITLGLSWPYALILSAILADNSFAIIVPLISKLHISANIRTIILVESTMNSVLSIGTAMTLVAMTAVGAFAPSTVAARIMYSFFVSFLVGSAAAVFWTAVLNNVRKLENGIFLTLAFVLIVYSVCETLGSDGAIGAFIFGIIAGNIRVVRKLDGFKPIEHFTMNVRSKAFNETEKNFFGEIVFVLRTFFFVYIGICIDIKNPYHMLIGFLFTAVIFLVRIPVVNYTLDRSTNRLDTAVASTMVPKGLVSAVLASVVVQAGLSNADLIRETIFSVILFSIIISTITAFLIEKGYINPIVNFLFKRHVNSIPEEPQEPQTNIVNKTVILK